LHTYTDLQHLDPILCRFLAASQHAINKAPQFSSVFLHDNICIYFQIEFTSNGVYSWCLIDKYSIHTAR